MLKCKLQCFSKSNNSLTSLRKYQLSPTQKLNSSLHLKKIYKRHYSENSQSYGTHHRFGVHDLLLDKTTKHHQLFGIGTALGICLMLGLLNDAEASETNEEDYVIEKATKTKFPKKLTVEGSTFDVTGVGVRTVTLFKFNTYSMALYVDLPKAVTELGNKWNIYTAQEICDQQTFFDDIIFSQFNKVLRVIPSHYAQGSHLSKGFMDNLRPRVKELLRMKHLSQFNPPSKPHQQEPVTKSTNYFNFAYTTTNSDILHNTQLMKQIDTQVDTELNEIMKQFENCFPAKRNFDRGALVDFVCSTQTSGSSPNNKITNRNVNNVMEIYVDNQLAGKIVSPEICIALFDVYCGAKAKTPELKPILAEGFHKILYK